MLSRHGRLENCAPFPTEEVGDMVVLVSILAGSWVLCVLTEDPRRKHMVQATENTEDSLLRVGHLQKLQEG